MKRAIASSWLLPLAAFGCGDSDETQLQRSYDDDTVAAYRSALPSEDRLVAEMPTAALDGSMQNADPAAVLAARGVVFARDVNETARDIARTLHTLAQKVPDGFSPRRERFVWGPWQSPTGPGEMTLEIRHDASAELEFRYELARQLPDQPETRTVVLWGESSPDAADPAHGSGYTALDLDANSAFELGHGGSRKALIGRGRFVIAYGHASRADDAVFFNLAAFRAFLPASEGSESTLPPVSAHHFYGRVAEPSGSVVDFLHAEIEQNLCDESPESCFGAVPGNSLGASDRLGSSLSGAALSSSHPERLVFGEFFVDNGSGRADVSLSGGDLSDELQLTECWNAALTRTSYRLTTTEGAQQMMPDATCPGRAALSFEELGLPTPEDVPEWLAKELSCAAENGAVGCP
jgi:hypothetical protein